MLVSFLATSSFFITVSAKEEANTKEWAEETLQPIIEDTVKKFNETWEENWIINLSSYLTEKDKYKTLEKLDELKEDIEKLRNDIKSIEVNKQLGKSEKKQIKRLKRHLNKALAYYEKQVKRIHKHISKDKKIEDTKKYDKRIYKSNKQIEKANENYSELLSALKLAEHQIELIETELIDADSAKEILKNEKLRIEKEKAKKAEKEAIEKEKQEKEKKEREKERQKSLEKVEEIVSELIDLGDGSIIDIRPTSGDDWITVYVIVDNSWHLLTEEEQKYIAETIGPAVESGIINSGITSFCDVHFADQNENIVASPKIFGGYKIKN